MTGPAVLRIACVLVAWCSLGARAAIPAAHHLEITVRNRIVWRAPVALDERFDLSFVHSQERTLWTQHYRAGADGQLWQEGSTFGSYGAGMPLGRTFRSARGFTVATRRRLGTLRLLNSRSAQLTLFYRGQPLPIGRWFEDYEPFALRVE